MACALEQHDYLHRCMSVGRMTRQGGSVKGPYWNVWLDGVGCQLNRKPILADSAEDVARLVIWDLPVWMEQVYLRVGEVGGGRMEVWHVKWQSNSHYTIERVSPK